MIFLSLRRTSVRNQSSNHENLLCVYDGKFQADSLCRCHKELLRRIYQHKTKAHPNSFTARYNVDRLVYIETFGDIRDAIAREKEIKGWRRSKKVALIESQNPTWKDLSLDWE